ncbi:hypothetical protein [Rhodohalobacter sp. 8-1]|uniref:hypothetical protein n=1 Tax=Rhodohalobacter sp. 8-1 TaxID=3131972 RepID=UPI0030EB19CB
MKISAVIILVILLSVSCTDGSLENNTMPAEIVEIFELSHKSPDSLNLSIEISKTQPDSIFVNLSFSNSSNTNPVHTLYHSSSFPQLIAYEDGNQLTLPLEEQFFFDDLNPKVIHNNAAHIKTYRMKRFSKTSYTIVAIFRYKPRMNAREDFWLVGEPVLVN